MEPITGIILAGGKSSRMGHDKGFLELNGKKFVQHIIEALRPVTNEIIIIANQPGYDTFGVKVYSDLITDCGPMGGIYTGLMKSMNSKNLVLSCDIPDVKTHTIKKIISQMGLEDATVPLNKDNAEPLCAVYSKTIAKKLEFLIEQRKFKLKEALKEFEVNYVKLDVENEFENINTPIEFENRKLKDKRQMTNLVFLWGMLAETTGQDAIDVENVPDTNTMKVVLEKKYPALKNCRYVFAVNKKITNENYILQDGDEVSLLPPFAGG